MSDKVETGYYEVQEDFKIDYGGAWSIRLKKGEILKYTLDKKLASWDVATQNWKNRKPPISGVENMDFNGYGWAADQRDVINNFNRKTKKLTKLQADKLIEKQSFDVDELLKAAGVKVVDGKVAKSDVPKIIEIIINSKKAKGSSDLDAQIG